VECYVAGKGNYAKGEVGEDVHSLESCPVDYLQGGELVSGHHYRHPLCIEEQAGGWELGVVAVAEHVAEFVSAELPARFGIVLGDENGDMLATGSGPLHHGCHVHIPPILVEWRHCYQAVCERGLGGFVVEAPAQPLEVQLRLLPIA